MMTQGPLEILDAYTATNQQLVHYYFILLFPLNWLKQISFSSPHLFPIRMILKVPAF